MLIVNLGTPDRPTAGAIRRYLAEFLSDRRVVETHPSIWLPVLYGFILPLRPRRLVRSYARIWTAGGDSPLRQYSREQADGLQRLFGRQCAGPIRVALGMRYGNPSLAGALDALRDARVRRLAVLPMYPQYSGTTTASAIDAVSRLAGRQRWLPELRFINHYHDVPSYIGALAESVRAYRREHGTPDKLLFSFHGIPKRYHLAGDPYHCECRKTARLLAAELSLAEDRWAVSFQSRFGPAAWLTPATDKTLIRWAKNGVRRVQVLCPGFSADCLETLEEVAIQYRDLFIGAGGEQLSYIPALNAAPAHISLLADVIKRHTLGWPEFAAARNPDDTAALQQSRERALAMGARQ